MSVSQTETAWTFLNLPYTPGQNVEYVPTVTLRLLDKHASFPGHKQILHKTTKQLNTGSSLQKVNFLTNRYSQPS